MDAKEPKFAIFSVACALTLNREDATNLFRRKLSGPVAKVYTAVNQFAFEDLVIKSEGGKPQLEVVQKEQLMFLFVFYCKEEHSQGIVDRLGKALDLEIRKKRAKVLVAPASVEKSDQN